MVASARRMIPVAGQWFDFNCIARNPECFAFERGCSRYFNFLFDGVLYIGDAADTGVDKTDDSSPGVAVSVITCRHLIQWLET
ncbi:unnamed protein product [Dovyalis caffra]|uniref:Uncharacterized protein n=1 Tax=Dovyalis caffra TaxID=77055 RepID=A0AAV1QX46_9ROSI|nr:unnamed protein product [Dovyalis caffra]